MDGVPEGLHFQDFDAGDGDDRQITRMEFTEWLQEGKKRLQCGTESACGMDAVSCEER